MSGLPHPAAYKLQRSAFAGFRLPATVLFCSRLTHDASGGFFLHTAIFFSTSACYTITARSARQLSLVYRRCGKVDSVSGPFCCLRTAGNRQSHLPAVLLVAALHNAEATDSNLTAGVFMRLAGYRLIRALQSRCPSVCRCTA